LLVSNSGAWAIVGYYSDDVVFYCSFRIKTVLTAIYLFGLGIRHYGQEIKHMWWCSHHDPTGALVILLPLWLMRWSTKSSTG